VKYDSNKLAVPITGWIELVRLKNFSNAGQTARLRTGVIFRINKRRSTLDGRLMPRDPLTATGKTNDRQRVFAFRGPSSSE
jgi:hypothetical protein